jgi:single-strand DNA-binding protein
MSDNNITIAGNVTRDVELKFLNSGQAAAKFSVAVSRRWQNKSTQEWEEKTSFFDVQCYGDLATNVANSINKGARVTVFGRLEQRSWVTESGENRHAWELLADDVATSLKWATVIVSRTPRAEGGASGAATPRPRAALHEPDFAEEPF